MLLSVGTTLSLICQGQIRLNESNNYDMILQETRLGWIIGGSILSDSTNNERSLLQNQLTGIERKLKNFWEMDDVFTTKILSKEEQTCEEHFIKNVNRNEDNQFFIALPFNEKVKYLGNSKQSALNRFKTLLRKFKRNPMIEEKYSTVMQEYIDLGHMTAIDENFQEEEGFYLPHHAVIKDSSLTTKMRVVFDGSAKDENGLSLNDTLMTGPTIQQDICSLLIRFLTHQFVLTGDIEKMYRQFWVREEDRKYQKIWWKDANGKEKIFHLNTVTFGLSAAPFLAIRCLHQLADDFNNEFPEAAKVIKEDIYVDDLLTGTDEFESALNLRNDVIELLKKGQLNMRQWASNDPRLLEGLPESNVNVKMKFSEDSTIKTLGLYWKSNTDEIAYTILPIATNVKMTKRIMLSEVAKIFDPLGFLGPVIIKGRMILHRLWLEKLDWDDAVPLSIFTDWKKYSSQLIELNNISFERKVIISEARDIQLHGFCDASEKGYGACIYIRSTNIHGKIQTRLLCSKARVAPIKTTSLPRLELCSASLLSDLFTSVQQAIKHQINRIIFWSDSMIALHWIKTPPHKLLVFVGNRVSNIQQKTENSEWRHVRSTDNPADHLPRGLYPKEFIEDSNWKNGPIWLSQDESTWPISELTVLPEIPELRKTQCLISNSKGNSETETVIKENNTECVENEVPWILKFSSIGF
ncbi:uncharacterized protein LOC127277935 [Leptopilina boulardi]|uniref:uncharacterized protein LOC127277935 n=1 Tax=Leptopilina boulardi TaxID=63433 RepID=UPI0021F5DCA6|nr:uncharacterized protein LOC127277935 [Leptopilina boulardi]